MHLSGATRLGHCTCLTKPRLSRNRHFSSNGTAQRTCMKNGSAYQVEVDAPEGVPVEEVMKRFKNESRRVNVLQEVRRRRYFENHQDMLKRKEKQKHFNKRMAKFDRFTPRLSDRVDSHAPVPFGEMFGQGIDDIIGQNGFGPDSLFGSLDSPFARKIQNPDSVQEASKDRTVGQWGSRKPSANGAGPNKSKGNSANGAPITARARKAAQAANAQTKKNAAPPGRSVPGKNQPKQRQPVGKTAPAKPNNASAQSGTSIASQGQNGLAKQQPNGAKKQQPNAVKKQQQNQNPNQRKAQKQSQPNKAGPPAPAKKQEKKQPVAA